MKIKVPDVPGPKGICFAQCLDIHKGQMMARCPLKKNHKGPHVWGPKFAK